MRSITVKSHLTNDQIKEKMLQCKDRQQFQRWQCVYLVQKKGLGAEDVADLTGNTAGTVIQWIYQYNHRGPDGYAHRKRGGRRRFLLDGDQEKAILSELEDEGKRGVVLTAGRVKEIAEKKIGRPVSKDYPYDLLHRGGWRKIAPRPSHPKGSESAREEFKKNSTRSWKPSLTSSAMARPKTSKS